MEERFVIAGVAHVRSRWFAEVAAWASGGAAAIEFVKCVSTAELRARIRSGITISAALVDASVSGVDRDLVSVANDAGVAVIVIADPRVTRDWRALGAAAVPESIPAGFAGNVVVVAGRGGAGASVVAMGIAQGLAVGDPSVCLADWTLNGDLATYHDAQDVIPALPELVDAHRLAAPPRSVVDAMLHDVDARGYALLLGVRRTRDWAAIRPAAARAALSGLTSSFRWTVCDITADLESEADTGSVDIEDRHALAHVALEAAELVVTVGLPTLKGVRDLIVLIGDLVDAGVPSERIQVVVNRAPRSARARAEITAALADLSPHPPDRSPVFIPERRGLELVHRCGDRLPDQLTVPLARAVRSLVDPLRLLSLEGFA